MPPDYPAFKRTPVSPSVDDDPLLVEADAALDDPDDVPPDEDQDPPVPSLTITKARRVLGEFKHDCTAAFSQLEELQKNRRIDLSEIAIDALVCGAFDLRYPIDHDDPQISDLRERARNGRLNAPDKLVKLAKDEVEDMIGSLIAAEASLKAASYLDEPLPPCLNKLLPIELARKINRLGHDLMRGHLPGTRL